MPRTVTAALQTQLSKTVTDIAYLLQWNGSQVLRWSNAGNVTYNGVLWGDVDFDVTGFRNDPSQDPSATIAVQNLDNEIGAFFMLEKMVDVAVDLYQFSPGALAAGDAVQLVTLAVGGVTIGIDKLQVALVGQTSDSAYSPRRRIDLINGFGYALPDGSIIPWGTENLILQPEQDSNTISAT